MDRQDERRIVTIVLRCAAIVTILIGMILTTQTVLAVIGARSVATNLPRGVNVSISGPMAKAQGWAVVAQLSICAWGAVLLALARPLAEVVTGDIGTGAASAAGSP